MVDDLADALQAHRRDLPEDATAWGWKEPRSIYLLPFFNSVMPKLRFVHWMRDGRDMAFSENQQQLRKHGQTVLGPKRIGRMKPARSIALWTTVNTWAADFGEQEMPGRYLRVRFEDLCAQPVETVRQALRVLRARGRHRAGGRRGTAAGHARPMAHGAREDARRAARDRHAGARALRLPGRVAVQRPILVTGAHRSGTTWVGSMLALSPRIGLIHEPFSPITPPGVSSAPFDRFFRYVTDGERGAVRGAVRAPARLPLRPGAAARDDPHAARRRPDGAGLRRLRRQPQAPGAAAAEGSDRGLLERVARLALRRPGDRADPPSRGVRRAASSGSAGRTTSRSSSTSRCSSATTWRRSRTRSATSPSTSGTRSTRRSCSGG